MPTKDKTLQVFGLHGVKTKNYSGLDTLSTDENLTISGSGQSTGSLLGTLVFSDIELFIDDETKLYLQNVLFSISQNKNIVTTAVNGRKGTIKEYISEGDFTVHIQGLIISDDNSYPRADVETLRELLVADQSLKVISPFLELWGIYEIAVTDYNIPQKEGFQNTQPFDITALSDQPIELIIND